MAAAISRQTHDPLLRADPAGDDRRHDGRRQEPRTRDDDHEAQQPEALLGVRGIGQGVAAQQDRGDRDHGVDEAMRADRSECVRRTASLPQVPQPLGEPRADTAPALGQRHDPVRAELRRTDPQGQRRGQREQDGRGEQQHRVRRPQQPQQEGDATADAVRRGPGGGRERVGRDQVLAGDDMRQPGGEAGQQEPVDADADQHRGVDAASRRPTRPPGRRPRPRRPRAGRSRRAGPVVGAIGPGAPRPTARRR